MSSQQPFTEQLCSTDTLQAAADWLHSQCPQYRLDLTELGNKLKSGEFCFQPLTLVKTTQ
jgi:hypothetical protein